ncbi:hypothetical protein JW906_03040 [bacterium]|nr:hypothetical protein [bacterium]
MKWEYQTVNKKKAKAFRIKWMKTYIAVAVFLAAVAGTAVGPEKGVSLDGDWQFAVDSLNAGVAGSWFEPEHDRSGWRTVRVPHTWQTDDGLEDYMGAAWYHRALKIEPRFPGQIMKLEFGAIYRDAVIWVEGKQAGIHTGSGWTPFSIILKDVPYDQETIHIAVRVDNRHSPEALPYMDSFDWAADGGMIRSARLRILPVSHLSDVLVDAVPSEDFRSGSVQARIRVESPGEGRQLQASIFDPSGNLVLKMVQPCAASMQDYEMKDWIEGVRLWHFDRPVLYSMRVRLFENGAVLHETETPFGFRRVEMRDGRYVLNGEPMRLMGVEWMPGSDPRYGMAESAEYSRVVLRDMKALNCIITRFHWQQDAAVLDFCDREGMLVQEEIPAWGGFRALDELKDVQGRQMEEMIRPHYNHPSIYCWGLCNEILSDEPAGHAFVRRGMDMARSLDPGRLLTFASNRAHTALENDASGLVDFISWNDYFESWYGGTLADLGIALENMTSAFPSKSIVISEYGLCECAPGNPSGDERRIEILQTHTDTYRLHPVVAGAVFFDYNDYRTHIGDKCGGAFKQRVHGVTDLLGGRKLSWEMLRREMSPVRSLRIEAPFGEDSIRVPVRLETRSLERDMPAYTLRNYVLIWTVYNSLEQPVQAGKLALPDLPPGSRFERELSFAAPLEIRRIRAEIFRPTGYPVLDAVWDGSE